MGGDGQKQGRSPPALFHPGATKVPVSSACVQGQEPVFDVSSLGSDAEWLFPGQTIPPAGMAEGGTV